jgi:serine/threonine protein kinase/WD40 repeat protein/Leucine-rich repeat (LRR) protein
MSDEKQPLNQDSIRRDRLIDSICDTFEKMYFAGEHPQIEAFLDRVDGSAKTLLLIELIELEISIRSIRGETIAIAEYQSRFPGLSTDRLEATIRTSTKPQRNGDLAETPDGDLQTLDSESPPNQTGNREIVKYFGDYELLNIIAQGGMGIVYKARQISLNRIVALKMIVSGEFASKEAVDRFYSEAKAAALLDHPGIVPIFEVGEYEGKHFFSMVYVEGSSLASKLSDGPLEPLQSARTMLEVARAVHYAHEQGVIHRDLKPSNILLDLQGRPRITDFGLAKHLSETSGITVSGQVLGTPSYMPPEQAAGQIVTIGPASDVYALGAILYSLTTGRPPFHSATSIDTLRQVVEKEPVAPRQLNSVIPRDLETIILKCLEKSLPRRYGSAKLLAEELQRFVEGRPIVARPISRVAKTWRWCQRNPSVASLASLVILLLACVSLISAISYVREAALRVKQEQLTLSERKAKEEERKAKENAIGAEHIAEQEKEKAKASEALTRRNLYVSDAARISNLIKEQNFDRAQTLLKRHIPKPTDKEDLRGFDWFYNWRQLNRELASYDFKKSVEVMDLSADEKTLAVGCEGGRAYLLNLESGKLLDAVFAIDDKHWSNLAFVGDGRLIGHGRLGGFKIWNLVTQETVSSVTSYYQDMDYQGKLVEHRIPAAISKNGEQMVCADGTRQAFLAIWNLKSQRPSTFPWINEGIHNVNREGKVLRYSVFLINSLNGQSDILRSANPEIEEEIAAGRVKDSSEWHLRRISDRASREYQAPKTSQDFVPGDDRLNLPIGHPVSSLSISLDGKVLLAGTNSGELQVWDLQKAEHPAKWTDEPFKTSKISAPPIVSVAISGDGKTCLTTDGKSWQALTVDELKPLMNVELSNGQCTAVAFLEDDLIAVGTSFGLVEIWSLSESKLIQRLNASQTAVTKIIVGDLSNRIYVSIADGKVFAFDRMRDMQAFVPQTSAAIGNIPWVAKWRESTGCLVYETGLFGLNMLNLQHPEKAVKNAVSDKLTSKDARDILFRDKRSEIVLIYIGGVETHDRETLAKIRTTDVFQHKDDHGRVHSIHANQHPHVEVVFSNGQFTSDPQLENRATSEIQKKSNLYIFSADLFSDERRLAILAGRDDRIHLISRDMDSDAILSEMRVTGIFAPYTSKLTCIDEDRVLISGVSKANTKDPIAMVWNTTDGNLRLTEVDVFTNTKPRPADASGKVRHRGNLSIEVIPNRGQIGVWDRSMVQVLSCETFESVCKATAPVEDDILFAYFSANGDVFAVLGRLGQEFRWARWDLQSREWITIFESKERTYHLWFLDASSQILYNMLELGTFQRWNTANGNYLKQLIIPTGSVESLQVDRTGVVASLLQSPLLAKMEQLSSRRGPGLGRSINWHRDGIFIRADRVTCDEEFKDKVRFTTEPNNRLTANGIVSRGSQKATLEFEGTEFARESEPLIPGKKESLAALSENQSCFVKIQPDGTLHRWSLEGDAGSESKLVYRYKGSSTIDDFSKAERVTLAPNGGRIAIATSDRVNWSESPFENWHEAKLEIAPIEKITSLKWSADNESLAVGLSDGNVLLHPLSSAHTRVLTGGHDGAIHDLLWMPDTRTLTTAGNDGAVVVWDIEQEEIRLRLLGHEGAVKSLAFDPTRNILYSGGDDGRIQPWVAAPVESVVQNVQQTFVPPNPNAAHQERLAPPSAASLHTQKVIDWLGAYGATYRLANFGILIPEETAGNEMAPPPDLRKEISVHTISFVDSQKVVDADLVKLDELSELRVLDLTNCKVSPLGVAKLKGLVGLHTLNLSGINLTGFDFEQLADSTRIQTLMLNGCSISDEQLSSIIRLFPTLRELELSNARVTTASASKLDDLTLLKTLRMASTNIDDDFLTTLGSLTRLEVLDLSDTKLSGSHLSPISSLTILKDLQLRDIPVIDSALNAVAKLRILNSLDLRGTMVTEEAVRSFLGNRPTVALHVSPQLFGEHPQLEAFLQLGPIRGVVTIDGEPLLALDAIAAIQKGGSITGLTWPIDPRRSAEDIPVLARLPKLERIAISVDAIPKVHFPLLEKISGLQSLELNKPPYYKREDVDFIGNIEQLRNLKIQYLSDDDLKRLEKLQNLETIQVESLSTRIDSMSKAFPKLRELACRTVESLPLANAVPFLESLESLTLQTAPKKAVWPVLAKLRKLKYLYVGGSQAPSDLELLQQALPGVLVRYKKR